MKNKLLLSMVVLTSLYAANNETSVTPPSASLINGSYGDCIDSLYNCQNISFNELKKGTEDFRDNVACVEVGHNGNSTYKDPIMLVNMLYKTNGSISKLGSSYGKLEERYTATMQWYEQGKIEEKFKEFYFDTTGEIVVMSGYDNAPYGIYLTEQIDLDKYISDENFRAWYDIVNTRLGMLHDANSKVDVSKAKKFSYKNNILFKNQALYKNYALNNLENFNKWGFERTGAGSLLGQPISFGGSNVHVTMPQGGLSKCYFVNLSYFDKEKAIKDDLERFKYPSLKQSGFQVATTKGAFNYYYYTIDNNNIGRNKAPYLFSVNTRPLSMRKGDTDTSDMNFKRDHVGYEEGSGRFGLGGVVGNNIEEFYKKLKDGKINADVVVKFYPDADESELFFKNNTQNTTIINGKKYPVLESASGEIVTNFKSKGKYLLSKDRFLQSTSVKHCADEKWGFCGGIATIKDVKLNIKRSVVAKNQQLIKIEDKALGLKTKIEGDNAKSYILSTNTDGNYGSIIKLDNGDMKCKEDQIIELSVIKANMEHHPVLRAFFDVNGETIVKGTANPFKFVLKGDPNASSCDKSSIFNGKIVSVWNDSNTTPILNKGAKTGKAVYTRVEGEKVYVGFLQDTNDAYKIKFATGKPDTYLDANGKVVQPDEKGFYPLTKGTFVYDNLKSGVYSIGINLYEADKLDEVKTTIVSNDFSVRPARLEYNINKDFKAGKGLKSGGVNKDLDIKLFDSKNNASTLNNLSLNKANLKVQSYEFKLENNNKQIDENNAIKIANKPISLNFSYPFASKATIVFGNDYLKDMEPLCRENSKVYNYDNDNKINKDGKVACDIPSQNTFDIEFVAQDLGNVTFQQKNNSNSNAVIFTDYSKEKLKEKANVLVLTGYAAENSVENFDSANDLEYVYREFYEPRDVEFDLKFDNKNNNAKERYIGNLDSNLKRSKDMDVSQESIVYKDRFQTKELNDKFNKKLNELNDEYTKGKKLSEIAKNYEAEKDFYAVTLALAYSRNYDNNGHSLTDKNIGKKLFNLTDDSKIVIRENSRLMKEYKLTKQPFAYGEVKIKDLKNGEKLNNNTVGLFYYDYNGNKKEMNDGVVNYSKDVSEVIKNLRFLADYDSKVDTNTGVVTKKESLKSEYVKDSIKYNDNNSDLDANGSFTVEFR